MKLLVTVSAVALLTCSMAVAADAKKPSAQDATKTTTKQEGTPDKKSQAAAPESSKPSPEMVKLARAISGRWQVEEKYEVSKFTPQGGEGKGSDVIHRGPGGFSMIANYSSTGPFGEYHSAGITTWSPNDNAYQQYSVDSGGAGGVMWTGKWDADSLVFTATEKVGEQTMHWRATYSGFSNDAFTLAYDMGSSDNDLKRFMTLRFTRMARQSAGEHRHGMGMHGRPISDGWSGPRADMLLR
jgi:hypothetical protein